MKMTQTKKDRAEKKVEIAIDKMIDLQEDFDIDTNTRHHVARILDELNHLSNRIMSHPTK